MNKRSLSLILTLLIASCSQESKIAPPVAEMSNHFTTTHARIGQVKVKVPYVALTFDDGPHASNTPRLLNILKKHNAKATFYVLGSNVRRYPSIAARTAAEGHEVAVHTWSHPFLPRLSSAKLNDELSRSVGIIKSTTGTTPRTIRPPYGAINQSLISNFANNYGLSTVLWSIDTNDWRKPGINTVIQRAVNPARPGSIILMHDIHKSSIDAVESVIIGLQAKGYKLVTVSELLAQSQKEAREAAEAAIANSANAEVAPE